MYELFYGLARRPFSSTPDAECFVPVDAAQHALTELLLCLHAGQGVAVLTAPAGTGKTLLCLKAAAELSDSFQTVFLPCANFPTRRSLLQAVLYELGHPYIRMGDQELRLELTTAAREIRSSRNGIVLLLDEAHLLNERLFEEMRAIANLAAEGEPLVRVLLSGQPVLEEKLAAPALEAFNQRIACQVTLEPLTRLESAEYIRGRLHWAGGNLPEIFTREAVQFIAHASDGLPRCLSQLCDHSLLLGYVAEQKPVGVETVREALDDLKQLPLHWNAPVALETPLEQLQRQVNGPESKRWTPSDPLPMAKRQAATRAAPATDLYDDGECFEVGAVNDDVACFEVGETHAATAQPAAATPAATVETFRLAQPAAPAVSLEKRGPSVLSRAPSEPALEFQEELVIDRYAMLEAGLPLPGEAGDEDRAAHQEQAVAQFEEIEFETKRRPPDEIIDEVLPLIDEALELEPLHRNNPGKSAALHSNGPPHTPQWSDAIDETEHVDEPLDAGFDLEESIAHEVLEASFETRQAIARGLDSIADRELQHEPDVPRSTRNDAREPTARMHFDVSPADVEDFRAESRHPAATPAESRSAPEPASRPRRYERLFSTLKRRRED